MKSCRFMGHENYGYPAKVASSAVITTLLTPISTKFLSYLFLNSRPELTGKSLPSQNTDFVTT
jgi:hypothetical protein